MRLRSTRPAAAVCFVIIYALLLGLNPLIFAGSSYANEKSPAEVAPPTSSAATQDFSEGPSSDVQEMATAMVPGHEEARKKELAEAAAAAEAKAAEESSEKISDSKIESFGPMVASNYGFATTTTASFTDMSTGTTQLLAGNIDDTASALTNIGFDFYFQGARFTQFSINDNGVLRLGATAQTSTPYKPLAQAGISIITAYGADQRTHVTGQVRFKVIGAAPNRTLVVEWLNQQSNFNSGGTADLTYQVRLNESTGVIEYVYGGMTMSTLGAADTNSRDPHIGFSSSNTAGNVGSVTAAQGGAPAPTFDGASATPTANLYTAGAITVLTSVADGARRSFSYTPPVPNAPTALNFTGVTQLAMTLNWTDSANETLYAIYRSTDGTNFSFDGTAALNATSYPATGLNPGTTYFWRVFAVSEGALSTALAGSQATGAAGNDTCNGAGGNWNTPATWTDGSVPTAGDNVTIGAGCTVTIDSSNALSVTVQSGGILQFEQTTARTLTVTDDVTVNTGGTIRSNTLGTQTGHVLSIGGDLTNNGTIDFSTNGNTAGAGITFTGATDATATFGAASTTDFKQTAGLTVNKGTNNTPVLSFNPGGTLTVLGANTVGFLVITNGTFKMDGSGAFSNPLFNAAGYSVPATGGIWMNNANATVVAQNGTGTVTGLFRMTLGTYNVGTAAGNSLALANGATANIEGGAINTSGRFAIAAAPPTTNNITYSQSGGTITVCTIGNVSTTLASFDLGQGVGTTNITGGTVIIQLANTGGSGPRDYRQQSGLTGTTTVTGGTVQFGNAASGAAKAYSAAGVFPNLVIDNTSAAHSLTLLAPAIFNNVTRNITINTGTTFNIGNNVFLMNGTTLTNNGTMTANGASSNFVWFLTTSPQTYQGTGVTTAPITNFAIQADLGLTINPAVSNIVVGAIRLFSGSLINSNKITLGNGGATTGVVQIGNTTTPTACGTFDVAFTFNLGTGGETISYLRCTASRSTGPEINPTRTLTTFTYDENNVAQNLTLAGGNLTTNGVTALTNGRLITGANTQIVGPAGTVTRTTGYVDGNFRKGYTVAASKSFEVGTANAFSPVTVNVTAGTFPGDFTVKAVQGPMPGVSGTNALQRYWVLTNNITGNTANLTFNYLATDVVGTAASYVFFKNNAGTVTQVAPAAAPTTTQATVNGVTAFSDWTLAEAGAFLPGSFAFSSATYSDSETNADHTFNAVVNRTGGADGNVSVDYQVTDGSATIADNDYTIGSPTGTLTWASGDATPKNISITVKGDVTVEPNETVNFAINNPLGGATLGGITSAVLTITNDDAAGTPAAEGELIISEFRLRGPNPNGAQNEFIEIYNASGAAHTVSASSGTGYGVAASDGVLRCLIPNGTVIPNRGHYLCVNSVGYSLGNYPGGNSPTPGDVIDKPGDVETPDDKVLRKPGTKPKEIPVPPNTPTATGDATYTTDIPDNAGIALFNSSTTFTLANRLDAVGSTSEANTLYKEGTGYPALTPFSIDYAFVRDNCGKQGSITTLGGCPSGGLPVDNDNNAVDFYFVDTNGTSAGAGQRLGAPGPENLTAPILRNSGFAGPFLDATVAGSSPPNRVRDFTSDPPNNSTFGTLDIRRRIVNNTGAPVTRLRFRIIDITTFPAPSGFADLRPRTSSLVVVSGINDAATCLASNGVATTPCTINVQGTTLEQPPSQLNGGGFNSSMSAGTVTLGTPLANGASINVRFLLGIQQTGTFKFFFNVEALP